MELFNELPERRSQEIEDFLSFIPIYESKRRFRSLNALLKRHKRSIRDKVVLEAGAGRGLFARSMAEMGAQEVIAVERSQALFTVLEGHLKDLENVQLVAEDIVEYLPDQHIDLLFHEFYGPLVLDETILALNALRFKPDIILPDGGRLWAMPIREVDILERDPTYEPSWREALHEALVSDLFDGIPFRPEWEVFHWQVGEGGDDPVYEFELPAEAEFIAFCGEITHRREHVLNMWWTYNWPVIYTPVHGKRFRMEFDFDGRFTEVYFEWIG